MEVNPDPQPGKKVNFRFQISLQIELFLNGAPEKKRK
jgi:hypothetical protein